MDCSLPGSSVHGIFQARVLEWGAKLAAWKPAFQILALTFDMSKSFNFFGVKRLHLWNCEKEQLSLKSDTSTQRDKTGKALLVGKKQVVSKY